MIVVDSSALIAIMRREAERERFVDAIRNGGLALISTASLLETTMVASRALQRGAADAIDRFIEELALTPVPVTHEQVRIAQGAFFRFGKGQGGRSQLNFGDCIVYGLARWADAALLFKGEDFRHTDVKLASASEL